MQYHREYRQAYIPVLDGTHSIFEPLGHVRVRSSEQDIAHLSHVLNNSHTLKDLSVLKLPDISIMAQESQHHINFIPLNI